MQNGHQYVLVKVNEIFLSSDLLRWRRVPALNRAGSVAVRRWRHGFDAVVDEGLNGDTQDWKHYRSENGRRWTRLADPNPSRLIIAAFHAVRVDGRWLALADENGARRLYTSPDREHWAPLASNAPPLIDLLVPDRVRRRVLTVQYQSRPVGVPPAADSVWSTATGAVWSELSAFRERYPDARVESITTSGSWLVFGGDLTVIPDSARMWASPDLRRWIELPSALRGRNSTGSLVPLVSHRNIVVGLPSDSVSYWLWHRPRRASTLVTLTGIARSSGGPLGVESIVHSVRVQDAGGREITRVQVSADGHYAVDLPPGRYQLRTECMRDRVTLRRADVRRNLVCSIR